MVSIDVLVRFWKLNLAFWALEATHGPFAPTLKLFRCSIPAGELTKFNLLFKNTKLFLYLRIRLRSRAIILTPIIMIPIFDKIIINPGIMNEIVAECDIKSKSSKNV